MVATCRRIAEASWFDQLMLGVILVNAIVLGAQTYEAVDESIGPELDLFNEIILGVFVVELVIRFAATGFKPREYLRSGWNVFDFLVVAASFTPGIRENATLLRIARLLRIVRAVRMLPDLRVLTVAVGRSIPGVASLAVLTLLLVYTYGMVGWVVFADHDPEHFRNIGQSMVTMFVLLTLDDLTGYVKTGQELSDWSLLFFVSYVLVASFLVFNLFIGIVINSMEEARAIEAQKAEEALLDGDVSNDAEAHAVILGERVHALRDAVEALEREIAVQRRASG